MERSYRGRENLPPTGDWQGEEVSEIAYLSPLGPMRIAGLVSAIREVAFCKTEIPSTDDSVPDMLLVCRSQLDEYFRGKSQVFDLKLEPQGTAFQKRI